MSQKPDRAALVERPYFPDGPFAQQPALQLIYDTAPIGLAFLSPDCRYLQINQRLTEICGISVADHLGRSVRDCVPALAESVESIVRSIMETGAAGYRHRSRGPARRSKRGTILDHVLASRCTVRTATSSESTSQQKRSPSASAPRRRCRPANGSFIPWRIPFRSWCGWRTPSAGSSGSTTAGTNTRARLSGDVSSSRLARNSCASLAA